MTRPVLCRGPQGNVGGAIWAGPCETGHVTEEEANQARWHDPFGGPSARRRYEPVDEEAERWVRGRVPPRWSAFASVVRRAASESKRVSRKGG